MNDITQCPWDGEESVIKRQDSTPISTDIMREEVHKMVDDIFASGSIEYTVEKKGGHISIRPKHEIQAVPIEEIKKILFENILHSNNPIVIYEKNKPIFWNLKMEEITGYSFTEIQELSSTGVDTMELLYGWSKEELTKVRASVHRAIETGKWYEDAVFTLQTKWGEPVAIAWKNEILNSNDALPVHFSIREGNVNRVLSLRAAHEAHAFSEKLVIEQMNNKDVYTAGHIRRVMGLSVIIAESFGYDWHQCTKIRTQAALHDKGKGTEDERILKKPSALTPEERKSVNTHAGNGVIIGIKSNYPNDLIRWMPHHSFFYGAWGMLDLSFWGLVERIKNGEEVDPNLFNHLVGTEIPEEARIISIADVIDAVASRRTYEKYLAWDIEQIIEYLEENILESAGLVSYDNTITLDTTKWRPALEHEKNLHHCIFWEDSFHIPRHENHADKNKPPVKIQFDPTIVVKIYPNGKLHENMKNILREYDNANIPEKIVEIEERLSEFEEKLRHNNGSYTEEDDITYTRLKEAKKVLETFLT